MYSNHYTVLNPNSNIKQLFKVKDAYGDVHLKLISIKENAHVFILNK